MHFFQSLHPAGISKLKKLSLDTSLGFNSPYRLIPDHYRPELSDVSVCSY